MGDRSEGKTWTFTQLGGDRKTLVLSGDAAPHGRARVSEVVDHALEIRTERTYYPGNDVPTRHVFGLKLKDWELKGRFRDRRRGKGFALAKDQDAREFFADKQAVLVTWGDIRGVQGFITHYGSKVEAENEIVWEMTIEVDVDLRLSASRVAPVLFPPKDYTAQIIAALALSEAVVPSLPTMPGSVLDAINDAISSVQQAASAFADVAGQIESFATAPLQALNQLDASLQSLKGTCFEFKETMESIGPEARATVQRLSDHASQFGSFTTADDGATQAMVHCEAMRHAVAIAIVGRAKGSFTANGGDTWEAIASSKYGSPKRAADIRAMNRVPAGQLPRAGFKYLLPA